MIEAKELRIGNLIENEVLGKVPISAIMSDTICVIRTIHMNLDRSIEDRFMQMSLSSVSGIPLTSEILEACGFKYYKYKGITRLSDGFDDEPDGDTHNWTLKVPKNEQVEDLPTFELVKFGDDEIKFSHQWLRVTLNYLHQLQNLYFSLTGKELTYSPNTTVK